MVPPPLPLDPELAPAIAALPPVDLRVEALPALRRRQRRAAALVPRSDAVTRTDHVVDVVEPVPATGGPAASVPVPGVPVAVRVHRAVGAEGLRPCVVSFHGGGLVVGTHLADDALFDRWCPDLGVVGVSVDYRLAPEDPYPAALDDASAALAWVHTHAADLGVDPARIGVRGVSAGAGLAAAVALRARDRGGRGGLPIAFQLLDQPMLDDRRRTPSSRLDGLPVWSRESNAFAWRCYLGDRCGRDDVPATAAPARATDLAGLPPAFVSVGAVDGFRDEAVDYATRLQAAGVPCELHIYDGAPHGYHLAGDTAVTRRSQQDQADWLRRAIGT